MWYDIGETISHNCLFNFVLGPRGCGKTYAAKKRAIKQYKEKGHQFVYLRRYKEELDETAESYFNDIIYNGEFPEDKITYSGGNYYVNDKLAGYAMALTKAKDYKSISYPKVYTIIFDEFLIEENGFARYLKNEVKQFLSFYMSIDRYRGVTVLFLANSVTMVNPYTLYWNISLPYGSKITKKGDVLLQLVENKEFIESRKQTRFGKLIEGTEFADYAIENRFMNDSKSFIMKKTEKARYYFSFQFMGELYGVWTDYGAGKMFVSTDIDPSCRLIYALTVDDHKPNTMLIRQLSKAMLFKNLIDNYKLGNVYFENQKVKAVTYEVLRMVMN